MAPGDDGFKPLYKTHKHNEPGAECFDPHNPQSQVGEYTLIPSSSSRDLVEAYAAYDLQPPSQWSEWTCPQLPGLVIISGLVTPELQSALVVEATEGPYLASPEHLTNLDAHYPELARPLDVYTWTQPNKKPQLRWVTLGGQYNWTTKVYPTFEIGAAGCPAFPAKLHAFILEAFNVDSQAAIVNYYSPGDILSPHQDVAELCEADLVSISLGCSCVFYAGLSRKGAAPLPILLHSGDIVIMGGDARKAFHGVGRVWSPAPAELLELLPTRLAEWTTTKRININVRQMLPPRENE